MHIANVIVNCRSHLANAEAHYGNGHKGVAAEELASLGAFLHKEIPGVTTEAVAADPVEDVNTSQEQPQEPDQQAWPKSEEPEQKSENTE